MRRFVGAVVAAVMLGTGVLATGRAAAEAPTEEPSAHKVTLPPAGAMGYEDLWVGSQSYTSAKGALLCQVSVSPTVHWYKHPKKVKVSNSNYVRISVKLQKQGGKGGSLAKTLASDTKRSKAIYYKSSQPSLRLPKQFTVPVSWRGTFDAAVTKQWRAVLTVRVIRNVPLAPDNTVWKFTKRTPFAGTLCLGGGGIGQ